MLNNIRICEQTPSIQAQIANGTPPVFLLINLITQYLLSGDINNLGSYTGEYLDVLNECIPLLDDSSCDDDARVRYQAANRIVLILWDYIKEMIEQVKKDQANGAGSTAKLIQNLTDALADQSAKASLPDRKGKPYRAARR